MGRKLRILKTKIVMMITMMIRMKMMMVNNMLKLVIEDIYISANKMAKTMTVLMMKKTVTL